MSGAEYDKVNRRRYPQQEVRNSSRRHKSNKTGDNTTAEKVDVHHHHKDDEDDDDESDTSDDSHNEKSKHSRKRHSKITIDMPDAQTKPLQLSRRDVLLGNTNPLVDDNDSTCFYTTAFACIIIILFIIAGSILISDRHEHLREAM